MTWASFGSLMVATLAGGVALGAPLLCAALGETFSQRSGVLNIGIEGIMLFGAFCAFGGVLVSGNLWLGVGAGIIGGLLLSLLFSVATISFHTDQIVAGFALILLGLGLSTYLYPVMFSGPGFAPRVQTIGVAHIPILAEIPVVGRVLFAQDILTYVVALLAALAIVVLRYSTFGIQIAAVGEAPDAADAAGINVKLIRYSTVSIGGCFAGLAGAVFSIGQLGYFTETMIGGRGFIAIALVAFGGWNPALIVGGALLFGTVDALQVRLQAGGAPIAPSLLQMLPYLLTIAVLMASSSRAAPRALTLPYVRE